jgi:hypothetical protein
MKYTQTLLIIFILSQLLSCSQNSKNENNNPTSSEIDSITSISNELTDKEIENLIEQNKERKLFSKFWIGMSWVEYKEVKKYVMVSHRKKNGYPFLDKNLFFIGSDGFGLIPRFDDNSNLIGLQLKHDNQSHKSMQAYNELTGGGDYLPSFDSIKSFYFEKYGKKKKIYCGIYIGEIPKNAFCYIWNLEDKSIKLEAQGIYLNINYSSHIENKILEEESKERKKEKEWENRKTLNEI